MFIIPTFKASICKIFHLGSRIYAKDSSEQLKAFFPLWRSKSLLRDLWWASVLLACPGFILPSSEDCGRRILFPLGMPTRPYLCPFASGQDDLKPGGASDWTERTINIAHPLRWTEKVGEGHVTQALQWDTIIREKFYLCPIWRWLSEEAMTKFVWDFNREERSLDNGCVRGQEKKTSPNWLFLSPWDAARPDFSNVGPNKSSEA